LGHDVHAASNRYPAGEIVDYWKRIWLDKRLRSCAVADSVRAFVPLDVRISRFLEESDD
jgi:hypothetical protein